MADFIDQLSEHDTVRFRSDRAGVFEGVVTESRTMAEGAGGGAGHSIDDRRYKFRISASITDATPNDDN